MNKIFLIFSSIVLLSLVSSIYPGESMVVSNPINSTNLVWTIVDNTSALSVLPLITIDVSNITIQIPAEMPPNSFLMVFLENYTQKEIQTIVVSSVSSGGHPKTKIVNNTVTKEIEVPTYISIPNNTIEYVNQTVVEKEYVGVDKTSWFLIFLGLLGVGLIIGILIFFIRRINIESKGGEENE